MKMLLNNGQVINDSPLVSEKTRMYINKFWKMSDQKKINQEKEKYYTQDYQRDWQKGKIDKNKKIETESIA
jgi:hypothetical protein